ncbi:lipopolysaccharide biosynthesis protein [Jeotgalibacillus campisalis]|uniref:Polysaccharide biosynthesis protein C-terminal domain-containing protein n=1 Tax=Jeotgalibacillus campisalis TaxID=220754 RepID=A0A0C2RN13_9BACL|nr:oligosaccharide flippase family protein [Jeotgalibacillus campisalis]KIL43164.1 hypothetical protein KR50_35670 [Jeotgalibacillus campisalis]
MNLKKNFITAAFFDLTAKLSIGIVIILLIRFLPTETYSEYIFFQSISILVVSTIVTGLNISLVRYESVQLTDRENITFFKFNYILFLVVIILLTLVVGTIYFVYRGETVLLLLLGVVYAFFLGTLRLNQAFFQSQNLFKKAGFIPNINNIILLVLLLVTLFYTEILSINIIILIHISSAIIVAILTLVSVYKHLKSRSLPNVVELRGYFLASVWMIIYSFFLGMMNQVDILVIKFYLSNYELATYGVAFKYYSLLLTLLPSILAVLRVRMAQTDISEDVEKQKKFIYSWIKRTTGYGAIMIILLITTSKWYLPLLNNGRYEESVGVFNILLVGVGLSYIFSPIVTLVVSRNNFKLMAFLGGIAFFVNFISNIILVPSYGIISAALTTIIAQSIINMGATFYLIKTKE